MKPMAWAWMPISMPGAASPATPAKTAEPKRNEKARDTPVTMVPGADAAGGADG